MQVYTGIIDQVNNDNKKSIAGQMSLFDFAAEEEKASFEIKLPDVEDYDMDTKLAFEKEVLGIYASGHPLDKYVESMKKNVTILSGDLVPDEEGNTIAKDGTFQTIGGMITDINVKTTRNNKMMAFITVEDLVGVTEVVIFPNDYERNKQKLQMDAKVYVYGKVQVSGEEQGKIICSRIVGFDETEKQLWIQFETKEDYFRAEKDLLDIIRYSDGYDEIVIYIRDVKAKKILPKSQTIKINDAILENFYQKFGINNVKVVEKKGRMN